MNFKEKTGFDFLIDQFKSDFNDLSKKIKQYEIINKENKTVIVFNACGIEEKDVSIKLEVDKYTKKVYLIISAHSHNIDVDKDYCFYEEIPIEANAYKEISYKVTNGLLILELIDNIPDVTKIKISSK